VEFETTVKLNIYETIAETTWPPSTAEVARALDAPLEQVEAAFRGLAEKRLLVLEPGTPSRIRMTPPFSGIETPFLTRVGRKAYYANCAWDAFGVAAALQGDGDIETVDGHTGEPILLQVRDGQPVPAECAVHFAVPAAQWWRDIIYT
jgi:hypothetical protein